MNESLRSWLTIPQMLRTSIRNQETIMAQNDRVLLATKAIQDQNAAEIALANAAAVDYANQRKAIADLREELAAANVSSEALDALESAVADGGKTADALRALADKDVQTPPVSSLPDPTPVDGSEPVDTLPQPSESETPGVLTPGGEGTPADENGVGQVPGNADNPDTDASGTVPSGTPVVGATEPSTVPERPEAPPVPTDADGNDRTDVEGLPLGTVDNSDGFLSDANNSDAQAPTGDTDPR